MMRGLIRHGSQHLACQGASVNHVKALTHLRRSAHEPRAAAATVLVRAAGKESIVPKAVASTDDETRLRRHTTQIEKRIGRADIEREYRQGLLTSSDFEDPDDAEHAINKLQQRPFPLRIDVCNDAVKVEYKQVHGSHGKQLSSRRPKTYIWAQGTCDLGLPDSEICSPIRTPPRIMSSVEEAFSRGRWLLGLLVLQSTSSFILDKYENLIKEHFVISLFLTMLVGAGGNAGNQSAIKVIRGLATGTLQPTWDCLGRSLRQQIVVALLLGVGLSIGGFVRVYLSTHSIIDAAAITASLLMIVLSSIAAGTVLPYALAMGGLDPANSGTTIQVVMDVSGVAITCFTCRLVLDQLSAALPG